MNELFFAYIDPGTGSMLFAVFLGLAAAVVFFVQDLWIKIKYMFKSGKSVENESELPYVIFSDDKRYWNVFKPLCDEFEKRKIPVRYWSASEDDPAFGEHYEYVKTEFIGEGNKAFSKLNMLKADILIATTPGLDVLQWKRSKNTKYYIHVFHDVSEGTRYRMFGLDFYDAVMLTGDFQGEYIRKLEKLRGLEPKELYTTGSLYLDAMQQKKNSLGADCASSSPDGEKTVLLAPSWGASSILNRFGADFIQSLINTGYNIIVRPHPQTKTADAELLKELTEKFPNGNKFSWNFDNDNFDVLSCSDVLISDFSGVMFDYALIFDRPLIYADTSFDASPYDAAWLDEPIWGMEVLSDLGIKLEQSDFGRMKEVIDGLTESEKYKEGRKRVKATCWQYPLKAAERTADFIVKKHAEIAEKAEETDKKQ